jgi:RND family efflux transporter MFP subunit
MALDQDALNSLRLPSGGAAGGALYDPAGTSRAPRRRRLAIGLVVAAVVAAAVAFAMRARPVVVETVTATAPDATGRTAVLNASGYVVARRLATVASKVTGRLVEAGIEEGTTVEAGQVLARLDDATARAAYEVAVRQREAAEKNLREIEVRLADARRTLTRTQELRGRALVAQSVADTAEADANALAARLDAVRAEVGVAESALRQRRQDLEDLVIRAPFAGVVISKDAQPGEMVSPISAGGGFTRTGIATIVDMESREIEVDVNEAFINRVKPGQPAEATLDAYPGEPLAARVINIVPAADRQKATVRVRIAFERLDPRILPDMGVKVRFFGEAAAAGPRAVALVPEATLVREGEQTWVWRLEEGRLTRRPVRVAAPVGDAVPVLEGLAPGDTVVAGPREALREGARATVKAAG